MVSAPHRIASFDGVQGAPRISARGSKARIERKHCSLTLSATAPEDARNATTSKPPMNAISLHPDVGRELELPPPGQPLTWRVGAVAIMLGVDSKTLERDVIAGRIQIRFTRYGARQLMHLNAGDVVAHLRTIAAARKQGVPA